jgi:hypothetical protein
MGLFACKWLRAPATTEIALHTPMTGITAKVLSDDALVLKRHLKQLRDNLLRTARGIGSPPSVRPCPSRILEERTGIPDMAALFPPPLLVSNELAIS